MPHEMNENMLKNPRCHFIQLIIVQQSVARSSYFNLECVKHYLPKIANLLLMPFERRNPSFLLCQEMLMFKEPVLVTVKQTEQ